jgi:type 2 lantibiotic biosynthesis protein LanM
MDQAQDILVRPFVEAALRLLQRERHVEQLLAKHSLRASLERDAMHQLCLVIAEYQQPVSAQLNKKESTGERSHQYTYLGTNTEHLLRLFPGLSRDLSLTVYLWVAHVSELIARLTKDESFLVEVVRRSITVKQLEDIRTGLSEPHQCGRTVSQLTFRGGLKLIYKPHDIGAESAWRNLINWLNDRSGLLSLTAVKSYPRKGYGWAEYVSQTPCRDEDEVKRYYRRVGYLLAILYFLGASDIHRENLIASGEYPVIVDLETVLNPTIKEWGLYYKLDRTERYQTLLDDSVARTGLLPRQNVYADCPRTLDVSALGMTTESLTDHHSGLNINSSLPLLRAKHISPSRFVSTLCSSFGEMYKVLMQNTKALLSTLGPITQFLPHTTRYVFRPTSFYVEIMRESHSDLCLHNGLARSIHLGAFLARDHSSDKIGDLKYKVINSEVEALELRDIPIFRTGICSKSLILPNNQVIQDFFTETGLDALKRRLASASAVNRKFQEIIIVNSLCG